MRRKGSGTLNAERATLRRGAYSPGERFGDYEILRLLGVGGMAEVYLARELNLEREVALKMLPPALGRDAPLSDRFELEIRQIAQLEHPNIIVLYNVGRVGETMYYTMQALEGGDLAARIRRGALPAEKALRVLRRMASALEYAHQRGLVHRDVKPENILFNDDDEPILTDFGIAKLLESSAGVTKTGMTVGTPAYISPEQARGRTIDARTDLYALGVILYEMLTGQVPFKGPDSFATIMLHLTEPVPSLPPDLQYLQELVSALMAKDPEQRIASATDLIIALKGLARPNVSASTPPTPAPRAAEPATPVRAPAAAPPSAPAEAEFERTVVMRAVPSPEPAKKSAPRAEQGAQAQPATAPEPPASGATGIWRIAAGNPAAKPAPSARSAWRQRLQRITRLQILLVVLGAGVLLALLMALR